MDFPELDNCLFTLGNPDFPHFSKIPMSEVDRISLVKWKKMEFLDPNMSLFPVCETGGLIRISPDFFSGPLFSGYQCFFRVPRMI